MQSLRGTGALNPGQRPQDDRVGGSQIHTDSHKKLVVFCFLPNPWPHAPQPSPNNNGEQESHGQWPQGPWYLPFWEATAPRAIPGVVPG